MCIRDSPQRGSAELSGVSATSCGGVKPPDPPSNTALDIGYVCSSGLPCNFCIDIFINTVFMFHARCFHSRLIPSPLRQVSHVSFPYNLIATFNNWKNIHIFKSMSVLPAPNRNKLSLNGQQFHFNIVYFSALIRRYIFLLILYVFSITLFLCAF